MVEQSKLTRPSQRQRIVKGYGAQSSYVGGTGQGGKEWQSVQLQHTHF